MRELTALEDAAAVSLCIARHRKDVSHVSRVPAVDYCPTCRADVVRLVDAPPLPEIREEDVAKLRSELHPQPCVCFRCQSVDAILSVLEAVAARNKEGR